MIKIGPYGIAIYGASTQEALLHKLTQSTPPSTSVRDRFWLTIVFHHSATSSQYPDDLARQRDIAYQLLAMQSAHDLQRIHDVDNGIYFEPHPYGAGSLAFVYPGQGSQYVGMLQGYLQQPVFNDAVLKMDQMGGEIFGQSLREWAFPAHDSSVTEIKGTFAAQSLIGFVSAAMSRLVESFGVRASHVAGHSYGELAALWHAGAFTDQTFLTLTAHRGRTMEQASNKIEGGMVAVAADATFVQQLLQDFPRIEIANLNMPKQTVVGGPRQDLLQLQQHCEPLGVRTVALKTACAFHTSYMHQALQGWTEHLLRMEGSGQFKKLDTIPVIANVTARAYPQAGGSAIRQLLTQQMTEQVRWVETCDELYRNGARVFLEVGPGSTLTRMFKQNLATQPHLALHCDPLQQESNTHLAHLIAQLAVHGLIQSSTSVQHQGLIMKNELTMDYAIQSFFSENSKIIGRYFNLVEKMVEEIDPQSADAMPTLLHFLNQSTQITTDYLGAHERGLGLIADLPMSERINAPTVNRAAAQDTRNATPRVTKARSSRPASVTTPAAAPQKITPKTSQAPKPTQTQTPDLELWLRQQISQITGFPAEVLDVETEFGDLGIDSLAFAGLFERMSQAFAMTTEQSKSLFSAKTIRSVVDILQPKTALVETTDAGEATGEWLMAQLVLITGFSRDHLDLDVSFDNLGIDSLARSQLLVSLVKTFPEYQDNATETFTAATPNQVLNILHRRQVIPPQAEKPIPAATKLNTDVSVAAVSTALVTGSASLLAVRDRVYQVLTTQGHTLVQGEDIHFNQLGLSGFDRIELWEQSVFQDGHYTLVGESLMACATLFEALDLLRGFEKKDLNPAVTQTTDQLERYTLTKIPRVGATGQALPKHILLIGAADENYRRFQQSLTQAGVVVQTLILQQNQWLVKGAQPVALEDYQALQQVLADVKNDVPSRDQALIFLTPELPSVMDDVEPWVSRVDQNSIALFSLAKAVELSPETRARYAHLGVVLSAANDAADVVVRGIARSLSHEWRQYDLQVSTISLADADALDPIHVVQNLLHFQDSHDLEMEGNTLFETTFAPCEALSDAHALPLTSESVVLLFGGGVGIAAEVGVDLAQRYACKVIALGRTDWHGENPFPDAEESVLSSLVYQELQSLYPHEKIDLSTLQIALQRTKRQRDLAMTARRIAAAGGQFEYVCADVTNPHDVNYAISHIQSQWGNIDVVIHAAGVVEDSLINEKSADSFRRVLHTKARSALYLYHALQAHPPRLIAFFSSLVAHTGNAGQTDYCAANEVLSAIAKQWSEQNESVRVVTYLWSVWTETGLASQAVQRLLKKHELAGITTSEGIRYFHAELADPSGADSVLITSPRTLNILSEGIWS